MPQGSDPPSGGFVVVDVGKVKKRRVRELKRGEGTLAQEVDMAARAGRAGAADAGGKQIVPVVVLVQRRTRTGKKKLLGGVRTPYDLVSPIGPLSPIGVMRRVWKGR